MKIKERIWEEMKKAIALLAVIVAAIALWKSTSAGGDVSEMESAEVPEIIVINTKAKEEPDAGITPAAQLDKEERYILAKIAMAEAEGESIEGKAMVIMVVLNRVECSEFPQSIKEVIFEEKQFSPVQEGGRFYTTEPDENCWAALDLILQGWDESEGALYFEAVSNGEDTWHSRNLEYIKTVGNHNFYK